MISSPCGYWISNASHNWGAFVKIYLPAILDLSMVSSGSLNVPVLEFLVSRLSICNVDLLCYRWTSDLDTFSYLLVLFSERWWNHWSRTLSYTYIYSGTYSCSCGCWEDHDHKGCSFGITWNLYEMKFWLYMLEIFYLFFF